MAKKQDAQLLQRLREAEKISLRDIRLVESHCKLGKLRKGSLPSQATNSIEMEFGLDAQKKTVSVVASMQLTLAYEDSAEDDEPIVLSSRYRLRYAITAPVQDNLIEAATQHIALLNIWPYWREFVQSLMSRMGLPPFPLPLLRPNTLVNQGKTAK